MYYVFYPVNALILLLFWVKKIDFFNVLHTKLIYLPMYFYFITSFNNIKMFFTSFDPEKYFRDHLFFSLVPLILQTRNLMFQVPTQHTKLNHMESEK